MPRALKVFRTAVGFRDAYVAVPSRAAALRAWGTAKDLFARGAAEQVTDPAEMAEALGAPGQVVYRTRGGLEEQVAALGAMPLAKKGSNKARAPAPKAKSAKPMRPKPSRTALDEAESAIAALQREQETAQSDLRAREQALAAERKASEAQFTRQLNRLQQAQQQAREDYQVALRKWKP